MIYEIKTSDISLTVETGINGSGCIAKSALDNAVPNNHPDNVVRNILEALVLAHACAGVDVASDAYTAGLQTAWDAISNQMDELFGDEDWYCFGM